MKINILEVINPEARNPIAFSWPLTPDTTLDEAVDQFLVEVYQDEPNFEDIDDCIDALKRGDVYWLDDTWCFTLVPVRV